MFRRGLIRWFIIYNNITWYMGNNGVTLFYISVGWNLAAARIKRGNAWSFNAISWFRDAALMKGSQNQRAYPHSTRGWGSFLITLGHWLHLAILSSTPRVSVMLLFYRDAMEQAIRKRQLQRHSRYPFLLLPAGSRIFSLLMLPYEAFAKPVTVPRGHMG